MPALRFAIGAYKRADLPQLRCVNHYVEKTPVDGEPIVLVGRPGLAPYATLGTGPIRGILSQPGAFASDIFTVSGSSLYRANALIGAVAGVATVDMAATPNRLMIATGASLVVSDGVTASTAAFPDGAGVVSVAYLAGYALAARADSRRVYFTLDPDTWDGLDYFAAEQDTGDIIGISIVQEQLWVFCERITEVFFATGDSDAPFQRLDGRFYDKGCMARDSIAKGDNTVFFIGDDRIVYRADATPQRISDHGIEERLAGSNASDVGAWQFPWLGHTFVAVNTAEGTFCYDAATGEWHELASLNRTNWRARVGIHRNGAVIAGDDETGQLWQLNDATLADDGVEIERRLTAIVLGNGNVFVDNLCVNASNGDTASYTYAPIIEARMSRDDGHTWSSWRPTTLGLAGQYRKRSLWRRWGLADPMTVFEIRLTDASPWLLSGLSVNDALSGRGRPGGA